MRLDVSQASPRVAEALADIDRQQAFDKEARAVVVAWVDENSGDVVRQFPTEQQLHIRAYWREKERQAFEQRAKGGGAIVI